MCRVTSIRVAFLFLLVGCGGDGETRDPCEGVTGTCTRLSPGANDDEVVQEAFIMASPGDTIVFGKGTFHFTKGLSLTVDDVTLRGHGMDESILSFKNQTDGAQGILVTGDNFVVEDLGIEDSAGDALKVEGTTGATFRRVRVEWTGGPSPDNGAYGLYPVQVTNVLVEDCLVIGASDAGIYVGQSQNIVVRRNRAEENVAGIEIENSLGADVYENVATKNTGGMLVFSLPGLQIPECRGVRVFDNQFYENNTPNFAPPGNIVGKVPQGTGMAIMAAHEVEVFGNEIRDNQTVNLGIISYLTTELTFDDPTYDPYTDAVYVHDNELKGGGTMPADGLGFLVVQGMTTLRNPPTPIPDVIIDGYVDPAKLVMGELPDELRICVKNNGDADLANLDVPNDFQNASMDPAPFDCTHPPLPAVTL